ncbi:hypothetical protein ACU8KH_04995 [Lachancea thermotolerans]
MPSELSAQNRACLLTVETDTRSKVKACDLVFNEVLLIKENLEVLIDDELTSWRQRIDLQ